MIGMWVWVIVHCGETSVYWKQFIEDCIYSKIGLDSPLLISLKNRAWQIMKYDNKYVIKHSDMKSDKNV